MKQILSLLLVFSLALVSCQEKENESDFVSIFNGEDLSGWVQINGTAPYTAENGEIVGRCTMGSPNSFLCTEEKYSDFILTLDAKFEEGNSGVMFRAQSNDEYKNGRVHGYQMELDPGKRGWTAGIYDEARRAWLYCMEYNQEAKAAFKLGEWNSYRIEAIGNSLRTFVNDVEFSNLIDDVDSEGFIGLQVHSIGNEENEGQMNSFKNIKICTTNLDEHKTPENPEVLQVSFLTNTLSEKEKADGWKLLWDGKTKEGWRGAKLEGFPEGGWHIEDGILTVEDAGGHESENGGDIVTVDKYENFIFEVDFKLSKGANSGIKYFVDTELNMGKGSSIGCEYQLLDDKHHPDALAGRDGNRTVASLYDLIRSNAKNYSSTIPKEKRINTYGWNRAKIIVQGDDVEHYLNGILVVKYNRSGQQWKDQVAESKYVKWENFGEARTGHILLQDHGNEVSFKNAKLKEL